MPAPQHKWVKQVIPCLSLRQPEAAFQLTVRSSAAAATQFMTLQTLRSSVTQWKVPSSASAATTNNKQIQEGLIREGAFMPPLFFSFPLPGSDEFLVFWFFHCRFSDAKSPPRAVK